MISLSKLPQLPRGAGLLVLLAPAAVSWAAFVELFVLAAAISATLMKWPLAHVKWLLAKEAIAQPP